MSWTKKLNLPLKARYLLLLISLFILLLDQVTKYIVRGHVSLYETIPVVKNFWNWTLMYNKGAAFSLLASYHGNLPKLFFGIVALSVSVWIINYILGKNYSKLTGFAMSFILGGALGNLIDRILQGRVTDFIQWYYKSFYWPAFNLADSFICIGVAILIVEGIFFPHHHSKNTP